MSGTGSRSSRQRHAARVEWWVEVFNGTAWEFDCIFTDADHGDGRAAAFDHAQTKAERRGVRTRVVEIAGYTLWEAP